MGGAILALAIAGQMGAGFEVALSVLSPPVEVEAQVFKGANAARFLQNHRFTLPEGRAKVRLSLAGVPIRREAVEIKVEGAKVLSRSHPPDMPDSVLLELEAPKEGTYQAEVTYFAPGFDWEVVYSLYADEKEDKAVLVGYARVQNRTEREFNDIRLRLATLTKEVLEEILRLLRPERPKVEERPWPEVRREALEVLPALVAPAPPPPVPPPPEVAPEVVAEYWEVTLPERYDLPQKGELGVLMLSSPKVKGEVVYTFGTASERHKFRFLEVRNEKEHGLPGMALPWGRILVFLKGPKGAYSPVLSEPFKYHPPGAEVRFPLGPAREVECKRKVEAYSIFNLRYEQGRVIFDAEKKVRFSLENLSGAEVKVEIKDRLHPGAEVVESSPPHERPSATEIKFVLKLKPGERKEVLYRVRYREATEAHPLVQEIRAQEVTE